MQYFALMADGKPVEIIPETLVIDGQAFALAERYHPDVVARMLPWDGPADEPLTAGVVEGVVSSVTMRQARLALFAAGKLDAAQQAIAAAGEAAMIEWEFAQTVDRASPLVMQMGEALGLDLDALFTHAATL